jgi:hypothetical protein
VAKKTALTTYTFEEPSRDVAKRRMLSCELAKEAAASEKEGPFAPETPECPPAFRWAGPATPNPFISLKLFPMATSETVPFSLPWNALARKLPYVVELSYDNKYLYHE